MFHGGTSFRVRWGSPRFSEDLDFMMSEERFGLLGGMGERCAAHLRQEVARLWPGSDVRFAAKTREGGGHRIHVWDLRVYPPSERGKLAVKVEFFAADPKALGAYGSNVRLVRQKAGRVELRASMPMPNMASLWADKIVAVAARPAFKWRDAFDLGFLRDQIERTLRANALLPQERRVDVEGRLREALGAVCAIYGREPADLVTRLGERLATSVFDDHAAFGADMKRWFTEAEGAVWDNSAFAAERLHEARLEVDRALALIDPAPGPPLDF